MNTSFQTAALAFTALTATSAMAAPAPIKVFACEPEWGALAQELGGVERGRDIGDVPEEYAALPKALADSNFDGRIVFSPKAGEAESEDDEDEGEGEGEDAP